MAKKTYYEKLKDPQWQKKRLEVMQANNFSCELCRDDSTTLNVHHKEYFKDLEPWEYDVGQLACLCENCHESTHDSVDLLKWVASYAKLDGPCNRTELALVLAGYTGMPYEGVLCFSGIGDHLAYKQAFLAGERAKESFDIELQLAWEKERK